MKVKYLAFSAFLFLFSDFTFGQIATIGMMSYRDDNTKPYFYFPEDVGFRLRMKEIHDKNGLLQEVIFYRDRGKPGKDAGYVKSDTIEEKQLYKNGKLYDVIVYYNARNYNGKIQSEEKFDEKGRKTEDIVYGTKITYKEAISYGSDGTSKISKYENGKIKYTQIINSDGKDLEWVNYDSTGNVRNKSVSKYEDKKYENMFYNGEGILVRKTISDHVTKFEETTDYFPSGKIERITVLDDKRNYASSENYKEDGSGDKTTFIPAKLDEIGLPGTEVYRIHIPKMYHGTDTARRISGLPTEMLIYDAGRKLSQKYGAFKALAQQGDFGLGFKVTFFVF